MNWEQFLQENSSAIWALFGVFITLLGGVVRDWLINRHDSEKTRLTWSKEFKDLYIVEPIIKYIDDVLKFVTKYFFYVTGLRKSEELELEEKQYEELLSLEEPILEREESVKARIYSVGSDELTKRYEEFNYNYAQMVVALRMKDNGKAHIVGREISKSAGKVLALLQTMSK